MPLNTNSNIKVDSREDTNARVNANGQGTHVGGDGAVQVENRGSRGNNQVSRVKSDKTALVDAINAQRAADRVAATQGRVQAVSASDVTSAEEARRAEEARKAEEARQAEEARRIAEQRRNEQLRRDNDARIAQNARKAQAERTAPVAAQATSMEAATPVTSQQQSAAPAEQLSPRVTQVSSDEVAGSEEPMEQVPATRADNLAYVDTETGELVNTTPTRTETEAIRVSPQDVLDSIASYEHRNDDVSELNDILDSIEMGEAEDEAESRSSEPMPSSPTASSQEGQRVEVGEESGDAPQEEQQQDERGPRWSVQDADWTDQDLTGYNGEEAQQRKLTEYSRQRHSLEYEAVRSSSDRPGDIADMADGDYGEFDYDADESESHFLKRLEKAGDLMKERFLNPFLLRIESEHVVTSQERVKGKVRTYGHRSYSQRVINAIGDIRRLYDCSIFDVFQLVQLRAGLGVGIDGTIANIDPDKFQLTDDQFIELCHDIRESQRLNGHPLGAVNGVPGANGVRDDTGKFVVVAKTRCFPLGYMPRQLIADLRKSPKSPLYNMTERQIQVSIANEWINFTYPQLCANTGGNAMYQARAIESMMRALMSIDGANAADLNIPDVVERKTLMQIRADQQVAGDESIVRANEDRHRRQEISISRMKHQYKKQSGTRASGGDIQSAATKRRRNLAGDILRTIGSLECAAKSANLGIWLSAPIEEAYNLTEQGEANMLSDMTRRLFHHGDTTDFEMTDQLEQLAKDKGTIEALSVADSLYRIGGWDAIRSFRGDIDGSSGRRKYQMTNADLRRYLQDYGIIGPNGTVSDMIRERLHIAPGQEAGFLANVQAIMNNAENTILGMGSSMFRERQSRQFIVMCMAEMAQSKYHGRESFTSSQVADWGIAGGGAAMIDSLFDTTAGEEAFMTQGLNSLGRKSPVEHAVRELLAANSVTQIAVQTFFDRFPLYGIQKVMRQIPAFNTISYLTTYGISSMGDMLQQASGGAFAAGNMNPVNMAAGNVSAVMSEMRDYQAGSRTTFWEGLRKNLMYDTVMAGNKVAIGLLYSLVLIKLGGVHPPEQPRDRYNPAEWKIGEGEDAVPIKWAWWLDDLSGIGLPLGLSLAICYQDDWSLESERTAANLFINSVANFNSGTSVFDAIDLVNNFDEEMAAAMGENVDDQDPDWDINFKTRLWLGFWDVIGDLTPTVIGQIIPWSKDYLFNIGSTDAHTASKVYNVGEGSKYTMEEAQAEQRTKYVEDPNERAIRYAARTNVPLALVMNLITPGKAGKDFTSYKYGEMPLDTMSDPIAQTIWDQFYLDLSPDAEDPLPIEKEARTEALHSRAEVLCQYVDQNFNNAADASLHGFVLDYNARVNATDYCEYMKDKAWDDFNASLEREKAMSWNGRIDQSRYNQLVQMRKETYEHYDWLEKEFFNNFEQIPWYLPRYVRQESDTATRYVDEDRNASNYLNTIDGLRNNAALRSAIGSIPIRLPGGNTVGDVLSGVIGDDEAHGEGYWYGNTPSLLPFDSPESQGKGHNYETIPYWVMLDDEGNPINDMAAMYGLAGQLPAAPQGRNEGADLQELLWGGQGTNLYDDTKEQMAIPFDEAATLGMYNYGGRPYRIMTERMPESILKMGNMEASELLGITSSINKEDDDEDTASTSSSSSGSSGNSYGYSSYSGGGYSGGGYYSSYSGGGSSYEYNPKIYSSSRQVYSSRPSGMSTRSPYRATNTYLRPGFYTSGSRKSYRRQQ